MRTCKINVEEETEKIYNLLINKKYDKQDYLRYYMWRKIIKYHFPYLTDYYIRKIFFYMVYNGYYEVSFVIKKKHSYI